MNLLEKIANELCQKLNVEIPEACVFISGSLLFGDADSFSDIDIAIILPTKSLAQEDVRATCEALLRIGSEDLLKSAESTGPCGYQTLSFRYQGVKVDAPIWAYEELELLLELQHAGKSVSMTSLLMAEIINKARTPTVKSGLMLWRLKAATHDFSDELLNATVKTFRPLIQLDHLRKQIARNRLPEFYFGLYRDVQLISAIIAAADRQYFCGLKRPHSLGTKNTWLPEGVGPSWPNTIFQNKPDAALFLLERVIRQIDDHFPIWRPHV